MIEGILTIVLLMGIACVAVGLVLIGLAKFWSLDE
jgi:hypothetical protein